MENRLLTRERMERMLDARTGEEAAKVLTECGYPELNQLTPSALDAMLAPLGPLLPEGGEPLERAVEETREELTGFAGEERARQAAAGRLTAAVCLSGACLAILVLM